jgi:hypothetical protein
MKNTAKRKPNTFAILNFSRDGLDSLLDSETPFESAPPLDSEVASELVDLFDLEISSLRWNDDQPEFHPEVD